MIDVKSLQSVATKISHYFKTACFKKMLKVILRKSTYHFFKSPAFVFMPDSDGFDNFIIADCSLDMEIDIIDPFYY